MVRPRVIVCLGAVAAQALMGPKFSVTASHLKTFATEWAEHVVATIHPSAARRAPDHDARKRLRETLRETLQLAKRLADQR